MWGKKTKDSKCWCKREEKVKNVLSVQTLDETTCVTMFNVHAHGMFEVGEKNQKIPKK